MTLSRRRSLFAFFGQAALFFGLLCTGAFAQLADSPVVAEAISDMSTGMAPAPIPAAVPITGDAPPISLSLQPPPTPTPTPPPPAIDLFSAIAADDLRWLSDLLAKGADPNGAFPVPGPPDFIKHYDNTPLSYYLRKEPGFTPLMFAAALGAEKAVRILLHCGADKNRLTKKSKTFALYLAAKGGHIEIMRELMGITPDSTVMRYRVEVDLTNQRAVLFEDDAVLLETKISSGKKSSPTPKGTYLVTDKYRHWTSTLYDARMPYYMRLSCSDFGLHAGVVPGYPASHGCVRLPERSARAFFKAVPIGTLVTIN